MPVPAGPVSGLIEFTWHGDTLKRAGNEAVRFALEQTAAEMVATAQILVHNPSDSQGYATGELQADISARVPYRSGFTWTIIFGSFNVDHAFWQEILPEPIGRAYIRPAAETHIQELPVFLSQGFAGQLGGGAANLTLRGYDQINLRSTATSPYGVGSRPQRRSPLGQRGVTPRGRR